MELYYLFDQSENQKLSNLFIKQFTNKKKEKIEENIKKLKEIKENLLLEIEKETNLF